MDLKLQSFDDGSRGFVFVNSFYLYTKFVHMVN